MGFLPPHDVFFCMPFLSFSFKFLFSASLGFVSVTVVWNVTDFVHSCFRGLKLLTTACQLLCRGGEPVRGHLSLPWRRLSHNSLILNLFSCFQLNLCTLFPGYLGSLNPEPFCSSFMWGHLPRTPSTLGRTFSSLVCWVSWIFFSSFKMSSSLPFS